MYWMRQTWSLPAKQAIGWLVLWFSSFAPSMFESSSFDNSFDYSFLPRKSLRTRSASRFDGVVICSIGFESTFSLFSFWSKNTEQLSMPPCMHSSLENWGREYYTTGIRDSSSSCFMLSLAH